MLCSILFPSWHLPAVLFKLPSLGYCWAFSWTLDLPSEDSIKANYSSRHKGTLPAEVSLLKPHRPCRRASWPAPCRTMGMASE